MAFAAPPERGGRFRGRQKPVVLNKANYKELISKMKKCDAGAFEIDTTLPQEEVKEIVVALQKAGMSCFFGFYDPKYRWGQTGSGYKPNKEEDEDRRRAGQDRLRMGSNRRFQVRRQ